MAKLYSEASKSNGHHPLQSQLNFNNVNISVDAACRRRSSCISISHVASLLNSNKIRPELLINDDDNDDDDDDEKFKKRNSIEHIPKVPARLSIDDESRQKSSRRQSVTLAHTNWYKNANAVVASITTWVLCFCLLLAVICVIFGPAEGLPGGRIFSIVGLYCGAVVSGWAAQAMGLPPLLGMLLAGIALNNVPYLKILGQNVEPELASALRTIALTILLLRAGLGLDAQALKKLKYYVALLGFVPVMVEIIAYTILAYLLLNFTLIWGLFLGFVLAAVSPAIVVPGMLALQEQGLGVDKGIPTLAIAAASFDNIVALSGVGITLDYVFATQRSLAWKICQGPLEVVAGIGFGVILGCMLWVLPDRRSQNLAVFRFGILSGLGLLAIFGARRAHVGGAGALACLTLAFVAGIGWRRPCASGGSTGATNNVSTVSALFSKLWLVAFQPLLFVLIGAAVSFGTVDWHAVAMGIPVLIVALIIRAGATVTALTGSGLSWKEKAFVCIAWMSKASVQAAVGSLAYDTARQAENANDENVHSGLKVLTLAVLSIVVTAPLGAIGLKWSAPKFLRPLSASNKNAEDNKDPTNSA